MTNPTPTYATVTLQGPLNLDNWTTATRPATPATGATGFNTTLGEVETWNGTAWVSGGGGSTTELSLASNATTGVFNINSDPAPTTTMTPVINVNESFSGTITAANFPGWNEIGVSGDSVAFPNGTGTSALFVAEELGGTTMTGNRNAVNAFIDVLSPTGNSATGQKFFYTALAGFAETSSNDGGTSSVPYGNLFGGNTLAQLNSGATFWNQCVGFESDAGSASGSLVQDLVGIQSIMLSTSNQVATRTSAAYVVGMQNGGGATGWQGGLQFGAAYSWWPIDASGSLISAVPSALAGGPAMRCAFGINLQNVAFTTAAIVTTGFEVDPAGNISAASQVMTGATGGNMGAGTINATGLFVNGVAVGAGGGGGGAVAAITSGTINGATIGASTPSTGVFTQLSCSENLTVTAGTLTAPTVDLSGGTINGTSIGATTPSTGVFTQLSASSGITFTAGSFGVPSGGLTVNNPSNQTLLSVSNVSGAVNHPTLFPGATGSGVTVAAQGTDTNIDLILTAKGSGVLNLGTGTATTATAGSGGTLPTEIAAYLDVKVGGTSFKIPLYNP